MTRREELLEQVTEHVLAHGLIGLTLRPLAAAIGTSDRMLLYHFRSRDELVTAVVERTSDLGVAVVDALAAQDGIRAGVNTLWQTLLVDPMHGCIDVYSQAAASGLIGQEPYRSVVRASNERWLAALGRYLVRCGAPEPNVSRIATLVDSALFGFHLELVTDRPTELGQAVDDLAVAAEALTEALR